MLQLELQYTKYKLTTTNTITVIQDKQKKTIYKPIAICRLCPCLCYFGMYHWTGNDILLHYIVFCKLSRPAFWHAFNKRILID